MASRSPQPRKYPRSSQRSEVSSPSVSPPPRRARRPVSRSSEHRPRQQLPREQYNRLRDAFNEWDADGDGRITREEVGEVMRSLRASGQAGELDIDIDELMLEIDEDGNGTIEWEEYLHRHTTIALANSHREEGRDVVRTKLEMLETRRTLALYVPDRAWSFIWCFLAAFGGLPIWIFDTLGLALNVSSSRTDQRARKYMREVDLILKMQFGTVAVFGVACWCFSDPYAVASKYYQYVMLHHVVLSLVISTNFVIVKERLREDKVVKDDAQGEQLEDLDHVKLPGVDDLTFEDVYLHVKYGCRLTDSREEQYSQMVRCKQGMSLPALLWPVVWGFVLASVLPEAIDYMKGRTIMHWADVSGGDGGGGSSTRFIRTPLRPVLEAWLTPSTAPSLRTKLMVITRFIVSWMQYTLLGFHMMRIMNQFNQLSQRAARFTAITRNSLIDLLDESSFEAWSKLRMRVLRVDKRVSAWQSLVLGVLGFVIAICARMLFKFRGGVDPMQLKAAIAKNRPQSAFTEMLEVPLPIVVIYFDVIAVGLVYFIVIIQAATYNQSVMGHVSLLKQALWKLQFRAKGKKFREHQACIQSAISFIETRGDCIMMCGFCVDFRHVLMALFAVFSMSMVISPNETFTSLLQQAFVGSLTGGI